MKERSWWNALMMCLIAIAANAAPQLQSEDPTAIPQDLPASPARTLDEVRSAYGIESLGLINIAAWGFQEGVQGATPAPQLFRWQDQNVVNSIFGVFRTGGTAGDTVARWWAAPLDTIPAGAQIMGMVLEACDTSTTETVLARIVTLPSGGTWSSSPLVVTGFTEAPGCALFGDANNLAASNIFVDKLANTYLANVVLTALDSTTQFRSVRVFYKLRVSSPPPTPTFTDVPTTHPFFQFIEALAASGITAGCNTSPPQYCPDATLTRGQMAVFLARALGLHFPN